AFTLGHRFVDASDCAPAFFHAYGSHGARIDRKEFLPFWLRARKLGLPAPLEDFCLTAAAAKQGRMLVPDPEIEANGFTDYAYHLPAIAYSSLLRFIALRRGVVAHQAREVAAVLRADGAIAGIALDGHRRVDGDFFLDVTGEEAQLLSSLAVKRESWREHFVADRVLVAYGQPIQPVPVYSEVRAWADGWVALHPTQMCTHINAAYSSQILGDGAALQAAARVARMALNGGAVRTSDPGRSAVAWEHNCVALGAAACVFDPLRCVDLQAVQVGLVHLLHLFPVQADYEVERAEYNHNMRSSFERIRDFQAAHYALNRYGGSSFWTRARAQLVSPALQHKIETFRARGAVAAYEDETFTIDDWQALLIGHGVSPESYDPAVERTPQQIMQRELGRVLSFIKAKVEEQPSHSDYLQTVCAPTNRE
ncbi:MAG TPA: tryptophan 7-halogenase, partial [Steroidobacteraceae bacterium]|nr:tryptophan 7-halogenase [Steroidobacteraceae bacterium]